MESAVKCSKSDSDGLPFNGLRILDWLGTQKNLKDGTVLIEAEGKKMDIESLIKEVETGPRGADVDEVQVEWLPYEHRFRDFEIRR